MKESNTMKNKITEEQFREKYNLYAKELFRISLGYTRNKEDSEDILQNVFLKFISKERNFKTLADEKYWLIRVTINQSIDFVKSYYHKKIVLNDDIVLRISEKNSNYQIIEDIYYYLEKMPKKYKDILILHYFDDLSVIDISRILNISESAVKMRLKRARDYLKRKMEERKNV